MDHGITLSKGLAVDLLVGYICSLLLCLLKEKKMLNNAKG